MKQEDRKINVKERRNVDTFRLAVHRTELANRRTLLAYVKTAIALFASSVVLIRLLESGWLVYLGWILLPFGVLALLIGIGDYDRVRKSINEEKQDGGLE